MYKNDFFPFGELLKKHRKRKRMTQRALAAQMGVHYNTIWAWELGEYLPGTRGTILELARLLDLDKSETDVLLEASLTALSPYWNIPYQRNAFFTGRDHYIERLHDFLGKAPLSDSIRSYALSGLGGIGKTQIALEFAYRYYHNFSAVFWLSAETQESLIASCTSIADLLKLDEQYQKEHYKIMSSINRWLTTHREWLLIVDNVEDLEMILPLLPAARQGSLLFTTRLHTLSSLAHIIPVEPMQPDESKTLFLRRAYPQEQHLENTVVEEQVIHQLVMMLGGLPLALDQAGAYIAKTRCSLSDFYQLLDSNPVLLLDKREHLAAYPFSVTKTFTLSFSQLQQTNLMAASLLGICCYLSPDGIPEALITQDAGCLASPLQDLLSTPFALHALFEDLLSHSLVNRHTHTKAISLHRLVKAILTQGLPEEARRTFLLQALCLVNHAFPDTFEQVDQWAWCEQIVPHALTVLLHCEQERLSSPFRFQLLAKIAAYLTLRARYSEAERLYQSLLAFQHQSLGSMRSEVADTLHQLGKLAYRKGRFTEAEGFFRQSLTIREKVLGEVHPDVAACLNNLGDLALKEGRYIEAENLFQRALSIREKTQGAMHPAVASPLNNLALLYFMQERYQDAEPLYERALLIREQSQGSMELELAFPLNNLALVYTALNRYAEAEALYQRAIRIREQAQGLQHPDLASPLSNLAKIYANQERYQESAVLYQRALKNLEESVGSDHQEVTYCLHGLAVLAMNQRQLEKAEALFRRALQIMESVMGQDHPELVEILCDLAQLSIYQKRYSEAEHLYQRALVIGKRTFGPSHRRLGSTLQRYADLLYILQRNKEAIELEQQRQEIFSQ